MILAASPKDGDGKYDSAEPNASDKYQDFGHTHWHNSLIWGENLENISILGPGLIWGKGLVRSGGQSRTQAQNDALKEVKTDKTIAPFGYPSAGDTVEDGWGNKSISLKLCRNVIIRDISILHGGHFAILATGVDNWTLNNLKIDTSKLHDVLTNYGIKHDFEIYSGTHTSDVAVRVQEHVVPFFSRTLLFELPKKK